jgi:DNA-directed RNA polymerase specialized sigma subunit
MVAMTTYKVTARRWALGWELHIDGVGVTQSRTLRSAEDMVREYIALQLDLDDEENFDVEIIPELDGNLATEAEAARHAVRAAERAQRDAAATSREVARHLKESGLKGADIATILNVSPQRVSQLLKS